MTEVTQILSAIEQGNPQAAEQLLPLVYDELRKLAAQKMAQEKPGQTLSPPPWFTKLICGWWAISIGPSRPLLRSGSGGDAANPRGKGAGAR